MSLTTSVNSGEEAGENETNQVCRSLGNDDTAVEGQGFPALVAVVWQGPVPALFVTAGLTLMSMVSRVPEEEHLVLHATALQGAH